jgi:hypothetical protein
MISILSAVVSLLSFRFCSRASLELELVALRHQLIVLRRQRLADFGSSPPIVSDGHACIERGRSPRNLGTRQAVDRRQMASQRLSDLLAVAITLSRTLQEERRNP